MKLKFASYNIHKGVGLDGKRDPERIIAVLREINADVIALQEADRRIGDRASVLSRAALDDTKWRPAKVAKRPRSMGWHGNALLVRRDIEICDAEPVDLPMLEPRGAVCADLLLDGLRFRVAGMHLDLSGLRRRDQIKAVLDHCAGRPADHPIARQPASPPAHPTAYPTVLMGDFNQWGNRTGAMREFHAGWAVLDCGQSFPSRRPIARLDRIVTSGEWSCDESEVHHSALAVLASDHLPVWATLSLPLI